MVLFPLLFKYSCAACFVTFKIRGSVPVVWKQEPTLDYEPPIVLYEESSSKAFEKHFREQLNLYENIIAVDLLKVFFLKYYLSNSLGQGF